MPTEASLPRLMQILVGQSQGGAERFFEKLAVAFQRRGLPQQLAIQAGMPRGDLLRAAGCQVVELPFRTWRDPIARWRLQRETNRFAPDVLMVWLNRSARRMPRGDFVKIGRLGGYYKLRYYRRCDYLIGNTPDLARYIVDSDWPSARTRMISNFGELAPLPPINREELKTPPGSPVLLALGRLVPEKGFDTLLEALAKVPSAYLWLAGEGPLRGTLDERAQRLGIADRVRFLGWRNDQSALFGAADICVVPSRHEPLSNVALEAWMHRVPVVATASEGPRWLIEHGKTGMLGPIDDAEALAANINLLLTDPGLRQRLGAAGHERYEKEFSEDAIVDQYIDFFREVTSK